jgi:hypothetical protein
MVPMNAKLRVGDLLLRSAGIIAELGRRLIGRPYAALAIDAELGTRQIVLDGPLSSVAKGLRMVGETADEVVLIKGRAGRVVELDRPLAQTYKAQSAVKVLV